MEQPKVQLINWKVETNKKMRNRLLIISCFSFMGIFLIYNFIREKREDKLLNNSLDGFAILVKKNKGNTHAPSGGDFKYRVDHHEYSFSQSGDYEFMHVGDSVLIRYAKDDHSVARVVDKYYMEKYKKLK